MTWAVQDSAAPLSREVRISGEAHKLLGCLANQLDDLVLEIAQDLATKAQGAGAPFLRITEHDVMQASTMVFDAIRQAVHAQQMPADALQAVNQMATCLQKNYHGAACGEPH